MKFPGLLPRNEGIAQFLIVELYYRFLSFFRNIFTIYSLNACPFLTENFSPELQNTIMNFKKSPTVEFVSSLIVQCSIR